MTLSELRTEVYEQLGEPTDGTGFVTDARVNAYLNEAQFDINMYAKSIWESASSNTVYIDWESIELPTAVMFIKRVLWNYAGEEEEVIWKTWGFLDDTQEGWEGNAASKPEYFFMYDTNREIYTDVRAYIETAYLIDYIKIPDTLSADDDEPELDSEMQEAMILFARYKIMYMELDNQKIQEAIALKNQYKEKLTQFKKPSLHRKRSRQSSYGQSRLGG